MSSKKENTKRGIVKFYLKNDTEKRPVLDVYESFAGWYWYIVELMDSETAYGFVQGFEEEWGNIYIPELKEAMARGQVWRVPKKNWAWTGRGTPMQEVEF